MNLYTPASERGAMEVRSREWLPADALVALLDGRRLSPVLRRIAQYLLDHMPDSAFLSSVALARSAGVSQPSVTRFAAALGFSGYPALREALRTIALDGAGTAAPDNRGNGLQGAAAAEMANLRALHEMLADPGAVTELGRELAASVPLAVLGQRISAPLAQYFGYVAQRIHPDVRCLTCGGSMVYEALLHVREGGGRWLIAFALPRYPAETVHALRFARRLGLRTAVVTDARFVPFAGEADVLLAAGVGSALVVDSHAAPMVLAAVIVQAMADAEPARARVRLRQHEELSAAHGVFVER
ncbi:MAG TPA: MurR/RpiR family transcriptional regulator [Streptosporangiaceae bacterium]